MRTRSLTERLTVTAVLTGMAVALQVFESTLPILNAVPGGKIGLANTVTLILLYAFDFKTALACAAVRAFLASLLYGGASAIIYSVSGAVLSAAVMAVLVRLAKGLTPIGVSVCGAFAHNAAQVLTACAVMSDLRILTYLPILGIVSCVSGAVTGYAVKLSLGYFAKGKKAETAAKDRRKE